MYQASSSTRKYCEYSEASLGGFFLFFSLNWFIALRHKYICQCRCVCTRMNIEGFDLNRWSESESVCFVQKWNNTLSFVLLNRCSIDLSWVFWNSNCWCFKLQMEIVLFVQWTKLKEIANDKLCTVYLFEVELEQLFPFVKCEMKYFDEIWNLLTFWNQYSHETKWRRWMLLVNVYLNFHEFWQLRLPYPLSQFQKRSVNKQRNFRWMNELPEKKLTNNTIDSVILLCHHW